jgi:hypothetical protein
MIANGISADQKLQNLVKLRASNVKNILEKWTEDDFNDMRIAYETAKLIAVEANCALSIDLGNKVVRGAD